MTKIVDENNLDLAAESLKNGGVVCFPTETVYGIGVVYDSEKAFNDLVKAKKRSPDKPFALMSSTVDMATKFIDVDEKRANLMKHFLPGEVTFLVKAREDLPKWVTLGTGVIGIRVPASDLVHDLIEKVGKPCLVTSANISGEPTSVSFEETRKTFDGIADVIVDGKCNSLHASTIIDITKDDIKLIREGGLSFETVLDYWGNLK